LGRDLLPNFTVLNNAIEQTEHRKFNLNTNNFRDFLLEHLEKVDFTAARKDVERFLVDKSELKLFNKEVLKRMIISKFGGS